jgi:tight adherence protein C
MSSAVLLACGLGALALAITTLAMTLLTGRSGRSGVSHALASIEQRYTRHSPMAGPRPADPFAASARLLRALALKLSPSGVAATLQHRLDLAGNPPRWTADRILSVKGLGLVGLGTLGGLYGLQHSPLVLIMVTGLGGACGFYLPDVLLYNAGTKRQERIQLAMPDALDMLTVCVEAGLGFDAALAQVSRNLQGPLSAEFARALQEMQIGESRSAALRSMVGRTTVREVKTFVSALIQAGELGIAVAQVLREQAREMRLRRRQRAEEKAQKVAVKVLFPLILCLFPALFVVVMGPAAMTMYHVLFRK